MEGTKGAVISRLHGENFPELESCRRGLYADGWKRVPGGGTTIAQQFSKDGEMVKAEIMVSPMAAGLGALMSNPALLGGGKGRVRRFSDGVTAHVEKGKITAKMGNAMVTWKGNVSPADLWTVADNSINRQCVKDLS